MCMLCTWCVLYAVFVEARLWVLFVLWSGEFIACVGVVCSAFAVSVLCVCCTLVVCCL